MELQERVPWTYMQEDDEPPFAPVRDPARRTKVIIIDDHPLFRDGLAALIEQEPELEVVGQAGSGAGALALAREYQPHLILLDLGLPDTCGLDVINQLHRICPHAKIAIVTGRAEHEQVKHALRLGVHAFLTKDMPGPDVRAALRNVLLGERVIGQPQVLSEVLVEYGQVLCERERASFSLTEPEIQILQLAAEGLNNKDIGERQFWSEITIKRKMQDIYRKMEVKSRAQAVAEAIRIGII